MISFLLDLAWEFGVNTIGLEVEVTIEAKELSEDSSQIYFANLIWVVLRLQERHNHEEESIGTDASIVRVIILTNFEVLFENKDQRFY